MANFINVTTAQLANRRIFIVLNAKDKKGFANQVDRDYFSRPIEVVLDSSDVETRQLRVTDPVRGHTYPVAIEKLKSIYFLTKKQKAAAQTLSPIN